MTAEEGELTSPREESPDCLSDAESSALKITHAPPTNKTRFRRLCSCMFMHTPAYNIHMYVCSNNNWRKRGYPLESVGGHGRGLGSVAGRGWREEREREKWYNFISVKISFKNTTTGFEASGKTVTNDNTGDTSWLAYKLASLCASLNWQPVDFPGTHGNYDLNYHNNEDDFCWDKSPKLNINQVLRTWL